MIARKIQYSGRVQGVGFRYTAQQIAARFVVAGTVRNLPGGDVELIAEGTAEEIERFLAEIDQAMSGYIEQRRIEDEQVQNFRDFAILRG